MSKIYLWFAKFSLLMTLFACFSLQAFAATTNPFLIDFPPKENLSDEDYQLIQEKLRKIDLDPLLYELYDSGNGLVVLDDFKRRCKNGIHQILIDKDNKLFPQKRLVKIGKGGRNCIVTCCAYNRFYSSLLETIPQKLEEKGFHGSIYYRIGGFPVPSGREVRYMGIPYSFKIFMMLEAEKLGFNNILWLDSSMLPLRDPTPLFEKIDRDGCFLLNYVNPGYDQQRIFPKTRQLLQELTGVDVVRKHYATQVFGLKMDVEKTKNFIKRYYDFCEMGTPFLSCFPEEFVFASIFLQSEKDWPSQEMFTILQYPIENDDLHAMDKMEKDGYYFYLRKH